MQIEQPLCQPEQIRPHDGSFGGNTDGNHYILNPGSVLHQQLKITPTRIVVQKTAIFSQWRKPTLARPAPQPSDHQARKHLSSEP
jgi:hypothetical protein